MRRGFWTRVRFPSPPPVNIPSIQVDGIFIIFVLTNDATVAIIMYTLIYGGRKMWNTKMSMAIGSGFDISAEDQVLLFKKAGFEGFAADYSLHRDIIPDLRALADKTQMIFSYIHAPFYTINKIWEHSKEADKATCELIDCLDICAENRVPIAVAHAYIGFDDAEPNEAGLENFDKVIRHAERVGVKVAFENTEGEQFLRAVMERFGDSDAVGFCLDTGHEMCYNHSRDMLSLYGKKIFMTHLNDNLGISDYDGKTIWTDDLHLLPFDGIANWQRIVERLEEHGYDGIYNFELNKFSKDGRHDNDCYIKMTAEEYITEAYKRACRVVSLKKDAFSL